MNGCTRSPRNAGFTLIELMIVVAVIALLLSIALPAYAEQIRKARRAEAVSALLKVASAQERNLYTFGRYSGNLAGPPTTDPETTGLQQRISTQEGPGDEDYYDIALVLAESNLGFELSATPTGDQVKDGCGTLTLAHTGERGAAKPNCW